MQKALSINLAGIIYSINEDAYKALESYFNEIKKHFAQNPDGTEIIDDIEHSIAEKFTQRLGTTRQVISINDVQEVMSEMGHIKDFSDDEHILDKNTTEGKNRMYKKKLFRDKDRQVIAGVCSGIAAYFGIDVVWVRIAAVALLFTPINVFVVIVYFVLWISMPEAKNLVDKMEMQGEPISLSSIELAVKNKLGESSVKEESTLAKILLLPFRILAEILTIVKNIAPAIIKILGIIVLIFLIIFTTFVTTSAIATAFFPHLVKMPFENFPVSVVDFSLIGVGYLSLLLPLIFAMIAAVSLIRQKHLFSMVGVISLFTLWMISIATFGLLLADNYPRFRAAYEQRYMSKKQFPVNEFTSIEMGNAYKVELIQGEEYSVIAQGDKKALERMKVTVNNKVLRVEPGEFLEICTFFCFHKQEIVTITAPTFENLSFSGGTNVSMEKFTSEQALDITLSGASQIHVDQLIAQQVNVMLSGSSYLSLQGNAGMISGQLSGSSYADLQEFPVATAEMKLSGSSDSRVNVTDTLKAILTGSSDLYYEGNPKHIDKNISGTSEISSEDNQHTN